MIYLMLMCTLWLYLLVLSRPYNKVTMDVGVVIMRAITLIDSMKMESCMQLMSLGKSS